MATHTGGYDPASNGMAERFFGLIKGRGTSYLAHSKCSLKFWYWACDQAAAVMKLNAMDVNVVKGYPTDSVL